MSYESQLIKAAREDQCRDDGIYTAEMFAEKIHISPDRVKWHLRKGQTEGRRCYPEEWLRLGVYAWKSASRQWFIKLGSPPDGLRVVPSQMMAVYPITPQLWLIEWNPPPGTCIIKSLLMTVTDDIWRGFPRGKKPGTVADMSHLIMFSFHQPGCWSRVLLARKPTGAQQNIDRLLELALKASSLGKLPIPSVHRLHQT